MHDDSDFLSDSTEERGRYVSISKSTGHQMTFKILSDKSSKIIHCSNTRPANDPLEKNIRLEPLIVLVIVKLKYKTSDDETITKALSTITDDESVEDELSMPIIDPSDLVGRNFLMPTDNESRQRLQVRIVKAIEDYEDNCAKDSSRFKFVYSMEDETVEEIMSHNEIPKHLEE